MALEFILIPYLRVLVSKKFTGLKTQNFGQYEHVGKTDSQTALFAMKLFFEMESLQINKFIPFIHQSIHQKIY